MPIYLVLAWDDPSAKWVLLALVFTAMASDYFDGLCARWMNQKTDLGRLLDPLADKILMVFGLIGFVIYIHFPLTLVLLLGYRDLMIFVGGIYLTKKIGGDNRIEYLGQTQYAGSIICRILLYSNTRLVGYDRTSYIIIRLCTLFGIKLFDSGPS